MIQPFNVNYQCNIFRAGGFNILPSENSVSVLEELDFIADSSVFVGGYERNEYSYLDFRNLSTEFPYWFINKGNVMNQNNLFKAEKILELPIFSLPFYRFMKYDFARTRRCRARLSSLQEKLKVRTVKKSSLQKRHSYAKKEYLTWDYCLFNTSKMNKFIKMAKKDWHGCNHYRPFVAIGHSKSFVDDSALKLLLKDTTINFVTLNTIVNKIKENEK